MQLENWGDLRFLLAVHRGGTLTAAAGALGVEQSTVTRRLRALEQRAGSQLYERLRGGAKFTRVGAEMVATAERVESEMLDLEARVLGGQAHMEGPVRITMPTILAIELAEEMRDFGRAFPSIELELVADDAVRSISKREADIAIRADPDMKIHGDLVARKVSSMTVAAYGAPEFLDWPWHERPWVGFIEPHFAGSIIATFRKRHGEGPWALRVNTPLAATEAARAGTGLTVLPCGCPRLTRGLVPMTEPEKMGEVWILTHPELRRSPRIRATLEHWYGVMEARARGFAGEFESTYVGPGGLDAAS